MPELGTPGCPGEVCARGQQQPSGAWFRDVPQGLWWHLVRRGGEEDVVDMCETILHEVFLC